MIAAFGHAESASIQWRGQTYPVTVAGVDFRIVESAKALGFEVSTDATSGVLTLSAGGHLAVVGAGTTNVQRRATIWKSGE